MCINKAALVLSILTQAVNQFYSGGQQQQIEQWLTLTQISPQAWGFCWDLLSPQKVWPHPLSHDYVIKFDILSPSILKWN